jgi:hypothetical protein
MFAVVGRWKMDANQTEQQQAFLTEHIVPGVSRAEGFVSGYWSRPTLTAPPTRSSSSTTKPRPLRSQSRFDAIPTTAAQKECTATS